MDQEKATDADLEATSLLLALRQKMADQFVDKKKTLKANCGRKLHVPTLKENNLKLGDNAADRCRQKFANLTKLYLQYIKQKKSTGAGTIDSPQFFDEMHSIFGN